MFVGLCELAYGGTSTVRIINLTTPPSDETLNKAEFTGFSWTCYDARSGRLGVCNLEFTYNGLVNSPLVTQACIPDASGLIPVNTCGNGGHIELAHTATRPVTFNNTPLRYAFDTQPSNAFFVQGPTSTMMPIERVLFDSSIASGIYLWEGSCH